MGENPQAYDRYEIPGPCLYLVRSILESEMGRGGGFTTLILTMKIQRFPQKMCFVQGD